jgi:hypothetical protein
LDLWDCGKSLIFHNSINSTAQEGETSPLTSPMLQFKKGAVFMIDERSTKDEVLEAVKDNGYALYYASESMCDDFDVVLAAVLENGRSLRCSSERLRDNYIIVLAAVQHCGVALQWASPRLQDNYDIVLAAVQTFRYAMQYASPRLQDRKNDFKKIDIKNKKLIDY